MSSKSNYTVALIVGLLLGAALPVSALAQQEAQVDRTELPIKGP